MVKHLYDKEKYSFQFTQETFNKVMDFLVSTLPFGITVGVEEIYMDKHLITAEETKRFGKFLKELTGLDSISKVEIMPNGMYIERTVVNKGENAECVK